MISGRWKFACWFFGLIVGLWVSTFVNVLMGLPYASSFVATICGPISLYLVARARTPAKTTIRYHLEWIAGPRHPVHPNPMRGRQSFSSVSEALKFMKRQAADAEFISLTEKTEVLTVVSRTEEFRALLKEDA